MKPARFIELLWEWVNSNFTGRIVIEFNQGGLRAVYNLIERKEMVE